MRQTPIARLLVVLALGACRRAPAPECICPPVTVAPQAALPPTPTPIPAPVPRAGRRPHAFALSVIGPEANDDKRARCRQQIVALGGHLDDRSPIRAKLDLGARNSLTIASKTRGVVAHEDLGPWIVADLCREVTNRARSALAGEAAIAP